MADTSVRTAAQICGVKKMSYKYDQVTDKFTHISDETSTTATIRIDSRPSAKIVKQVELTDDCIDRIADAVVRKLRGEQDG